MTTARWLGLALAVAIIALVWSLRSGAANDEKAREAGDRADSIQALRLKDQARATADSAALVVERGRTAQREAEIDAQREAIRRQGQAAARQADTAQAQLRATLDSLGVSTASLDRLVAAHAAEVAKLEQQLILADSLTSSKSGLLMVTDRALASRDDAYQKLLPENAALRAQVGALNAARRRDRLAAAAGVVVVVLAAVVTH